MVIFLVLGLSTALILPRSISSIEEELESLTEMGLSMPDLNSIADGVYRGEYGNIAISVVLDVYMTDHLLTKIDLIEHKNGQGADAERITEEIVRSQSLQVDTISGATYSSLVILKAVEEALK